MKINFNYKPWLTALCLAGAMLMPSAYAAAVFELDGNAVSSSTANGDDWDVLNSNGVHQVGDPVAIAPVFIKDSAPEDAMAQFSGGGSKDELDISKWGWRSGSPPDKNDITNAYTAAYMDANDHFILVFGMDRLDTSGDAQLGFWFLQGGGKPVAGGSFSGTHAPGDILVLANFSNGGTVPTISVYEWNGAGVTLISEPGAVECDGYIPAGEKFCGITNPNAVASPWEYIAKGTSADGDFASGAFFEGAIDLTAMIGGDALPCFTNFLTESRSSTSITAILKDFAYGGFNVCGMTVTKDCLGKGINDGGNTDPADDSITYDISGKVVNTGIGTLYDITLTDSPDKIDGDFTWNDCATVPQPLPSTDGKLDSLGPKAEACYANTQTLSIENDSAANTVDTISASANTSSDGTGVTVTNSNTNIPPSEADSSSAQCQYTVPSSIELTKTCHAEVATNATYVYALVKYTATACNTSDVRIYNVQLQEKHEDKALVDLLATPVSLSPKGVSNGSDCVTVNSSYIPTKAYSDFGTPPAVAPTTTTTPSLVKFKDTVSLKAGAYDVLREPVTAAPVDAICPLCCTGSSCG